VDNDFNTISLLFYMVKVKWKVKNIGGDTMESTSDKTYVYSSTLSSKNQVTIPMKVREVLGAEPGDQVMFVYGENQEVTLKVRKKNSLLSLFGSMPPKGDKSARGWDKIRRQAREERISSRWKKEDDTCTF
jgi:antitoxin PrlF